ncbi:MAG: N-acetylmuramoyl-L-alanine amidase [Mogibacterium sp.]|nr:N-acetylmuramoyl-L-alanine amidase [Mogibacterium sp.]
MQLTDDEIRQIILEERKRRKKKQKIKRRITLALLLLLIIFLGVGIFMNRGARTTARGVIFIDPGHGGVDGGSVVGERCEKDDALALALAVSEDLKDQGFKVYLSRTDDSDVERSKRGEMANEKNAGLMVSIHRNKAEEGNGVEVYIPSSNTKESQLLGNNVMKALVSQGFLERSVRAGTLVTSNDDYLENSVPTMPSCLVEVGFMQDAGDNKIFDEKRDDIAKALSDAITETYAAIYESEEEEQ